MLSLAMIATVNAVWGAPRAVIDLRGTWDFYADVGDSTLPEAGKPSGKIVVPGAWQAQGYGQPGGTIPSANIGPGTSPAEYLRHNLMARCLYVRAVQVPADWEGQRVFLCVRRAYRYTDATVNGTRVGEYEGFCSPFEFEITGALQFGRSNQLILGVDNRPRPGRDTLGTGNLFGNWGGLGGAVYLEARPPVRLADVFAMPHVAPPRVVLRVTIQSDAGPAPESLQLRAEVVPWGTGGLGGQPAWEGTAKWAGPPGERAALDLAVPMASARLWSPEDPFLYIARVKLVSGARILDEVPVRFGLREISARGRQLFLNGNPLYLSGYGDDATEPITGMLPADKGVYRQRLSLMRSLGFNFVRHHSCVPHDEYFEAADEVGMLVQPEAGLAYTGFWRTGHQLFEREWPRIVESFRNHPSVWAWCMGNELFLNELPAEFNRDRVLQIVERAYRQAKELDPTRLVHASDGGTPQPFTDVLSSGRAEGSAKPYLLHEYGTYCCSLPDFTLISRLGGVIRPLTYERAERFVFERRLGEVYPRLKRSSLLMRADAQKHYMESARLNRSNCGYSFWLGVDFPDSPEGCWDEGLLNQLWEPKPYLTNNLVDFNGTTVLLTSAGIDARSFYLDQPPRVGIRLWHYGTAPIEGARLLWHLQEGERTLQRGEVPSVACGPGEMTSVADLPLDPQPAETPRFLNLHVELWRGSSRLARNSWEFYGYPAVKPRETTAGLYSEAGPLSGATELGDQQAVPGDVRLLITRRLDGQRHRALLERGRAAVLVLGTGGFKETRGGYFLNSHGTGFGGIIEPHPVFDGIPHDGRLHLGLYQLIAGGGVLETEAMPAAFQEGSVVWGLRLTGWISPVKNLRKVAHFCDVMTDKELHVVLCNLDLLSGRPESRYVLDRAVDYLLAGQPSPRTKRCGTSEVEALLR